MDGSERDPGPATFSAAGSARLTRPEDLVDDLVVVVDIELGPQRKVIAEFVGELRLGLPHAGVERLEISRVKVERAGLAGERLGAAGVVEDLVVALVPFKIRAVLGANRPPTRRRKCCVPS